MLWLIRVVVLLMTWIDKLLGFKKVPGAFHYGERGFLEKLMGVYSEHKKVILIKPGLYKFGADDLVLYAHNDQGKAFRGSVISVKWRKVSRVPDDERMLCGFEDDGIEDDDIENIWQCLELLTPQLDGINRIITGCTKRNLPERFINHERIGPFLEICQVEFTNMCWLCGESCGE